MSKNLNEPAFPVTNCADHEFTGLSLRDYFACQALQGLCAHPMGPKQKSNETMSQSHARAAYEYADAMLAERAK